MAGLGTQGGDFGGGACGNHLCGAYKNLEFGIYCHASDRVYAWETVDRTAYDVSWTGADVFKIELLSTSVIQYLKNGVVFHTSSTTPTFPLQVGASFERVGNALSDVTIHSVKPAYAKMAVCANGFETIVDSDRCVAAANALDPSSAAANQAQNEGWPILHTNQAQYHSGCTYNPGSKLVYFMSLASAIQDNDVTQHSQWDYCQSSG